MCSLLFDVLVRSGISSPKRTVESESTKSVRRSDSRISPKGRKPERMTTGRRAGEIRRWSILCCFVLVVSPIVSCWYLYMSCRPQFCFRSVILVVLTGTPEGSKTSLASRARISCYFLLVMSVINLLRSIMNWRLGRGSWTS